MKKLITGLVLITSFSFSSPVKAQDSLNMTMLGWLDYTAQLSNIWGYASEGKEYALVGTMNGMSLVDVTDPANPNEVYFKQGPNSTWREIKVFNDHAYVVTEGGGGLQIIDMSPLPQNTNLSSVNFTGTTHQFTSAHTLYIDENGILYIFGSDYGEGGALIYDLNNDPSSPVELGVFDDYYIHDGFARGDTLWASCIYEGFLSIIDVTDKANPTVYTTFNTPSNFTHNSWPTANNNFLFTTDEVNNAYVTSYDVSDFNNISEIDRFQHYPGTGSLPHNVHLRDNFLVTSYYKDGVVVIDVSDPRNLVEAGFYDTAPTQSGAGMTGCWGVYPYLPSGNIVASDMQSGLWILNFNNTEACLLEGNVTDFTTGNPLNGVSVEIISTTGITTTNLTGDYATGFATAATYTVQFSKAGYITETVPNVVLTNGNTTILDVALTADVPFAFSGQVVEEGSGSPIPNAFVKMYNNNFNYDLTTDNNGMFNVPQFFAGNYTIVAGKWEYVTKCENSLALSSLSGTTIIELESGDYDDFSFNFGWTSTGTSPTGRWERGVPVATDLNGTESNPGYDVADDCIDLAYITGNDGGSAGDDDVDDGNVILNSPVFDLTAYNEPYIHYSRWFYNGGGNGSNPNDSLIIELSNGTETVAVERISSNTPGMSQWVEKSFKVSDFITATATMRLKATATDFNPGHLVEGGLDKFMVTDSSSIGLSKISAASHLNIYPNPSDGAFTIEYYFPENITAASLEVYDITGRMILSETVSKKGKHIVNKNLKQGVYIIKLADEQGISLSAEKLVIK